jgi:hypothetical protein
MEDDHDMAADGGEVDEDDMLDMLDDTDDAGLACEPGLRYEEVHRVRVEHNPEAILFIPPQPRPLPLSAHASHPHPNTTSAPSTSDANLPSSSRTARTAGSLDSAELAGYAGWLLYTTRSSHLLHYLCPLTLTARTKSFNAHPLDTHVSFSVLNMALHPSGRVVACQTGDGMAGERVLLYDAHPDEVCHLLLWGWIDVSGCVVCGVWCVQKGVGHATGKERKKPSI